MELNPRALGSAVRALLRAVPVRARPAFLASVGLPPDIDIDDLSTAEVPITWDDVHGNRIMNERVYLDEDELKPLLGDNWMKYVNNMNHFIQVVLEGWLMEGRSFESEEAKQEAIGRVVDGAREEAKKDVRRWVRRHCDHIR